MQSTEIPEINTIMTKTLAMGSICINIYDY